MRNGMHKENMRGILPVNIFSYVWISFGSYSTSQLHALSSRSRMTSIKGFASECKLRDISLDLVFWYIHCIYKGHRKTQKSHFIKNIGSLKSLLWYFICNLSGILILCSRRMSEVIHSLTMNQPNLTRTRSRCHTCPRSHRWWSWFTFTLPPAVVQSSRRGGSCC